jgi:Protein of unknown function (DUF4239)
MEPVLVAVLVFVLVFGGALAGLAAGRWLPEHHQDAETRDAVKLVMGLIATVSALVLSLLIASAHNSYNKQENEVQQLGAHIAQLNQVLASYGPEADGVRAQLRRLGETELVRIWRHAAPTSTLAPANLGHGEEIYQKLAALTPKDEAQRFAQTRALQLATTMDGTRRLLYEQAGGSLSWPFFVVLVFWLVTLFIGFSLYARRNATAIAAFFVGALTVAGAIFLILDLYRPYSGLMQISSAPIRNALMQIDR